MTTHVHSSRSAHAWALLLASPDVTAEGTIAAVASATGIAGTLVAKLRRRLLDLRSRGVAPTGSWEGDRRDGLPPRAARAQADWKAVRAYWQAHPDPVDQTEARVAAALGIASRQAHHMASRLVTLGTTGAEPPVAWAEARKVPLSTLTGRRPRKVTAPELTRARMTPEEVGQRQREAERRWMDGHAHRATKAAAGKAAGDALAQRHRAAARVFRVNISPLRRPRVAADGTREHSSPGVQAPEIDQGR